jgi:hypothetical protein
MKAERDALNASRRAEAAEARKALAEIDYLQARNWEQRLYHAAVLNGCGSSTGPVVPEPLWP